LHDADVDQSKEQTEETDVPVGSVHSFGRVTGGVPAGVTESGGDPDGAADGRVTGQCDTDQDDEHQNEGNILQGVLVGSLNAVEDGIFVAVHVRVLDVVLLASFANFQRQMDVHDDHVDNGEHNVAEVGTKKVDWNTHDLFLCSCKLTTIYS